MKATVKPEMLRWARERAALTLDALARSMHVQPDRVEVWEDNGELTLKQLEKLAKSTYTPLGYLFLPEPPVERLPIPDLRTMGSRQLGRPSPNLLDTIHICQQRQSWYRDYLRSDGAPPKDFVRSVRVGASVVRTAQAIRQRLNFDLDARRRLPTWTDALRQFIEQADAAGILVMCSGVVRNNNRRRLDPDEFRGFAMADPLAPLVFVNGADSKAAQMFTLAHELAHIWAGESAVSDIDARVEPTHRVEQWCNQVAAELLVPLEALQNQIQPGTVLMDEVSHLARLFKVSTLMILLRLLESGRLTRAAFQREYDAELERLRGRKSSGGDFYLAQAARAGKRFARALVADTLEGRTLYRDALQLLGISKIDTFHELGRSLKFRV